MHLIWAPPGGLETWTLLRWTHELIAEERPAYLTGHPELSVKRGWTNALWIATEEDAGTLRAKADMVRLGLGGGSRPAALSGTLKYLFQPTPGGGSHWTICPRSLNARGRLML